MQDMTEEREWEEFTREMMIVSGFELGARNVIDRNTMKIANFKYSETEITGEMLENEGNVREANQYAFLNSPSPLSRNVWRH